MNINTKKVIAREFLFLIGIIAITLVVGLILFLRNTDLTNRGSSLNEKADSIKFEIEIIKSKYDFAFDEYGIPIKVTTWTPPKDAILVDTILEKLNSREYTEDGLPILKKDNLKRGPWNLNWGQKKSPTNEAIDSLNLLTGVLKEQRDDSRNYSNKVWTDKEVSLILTGLFTVLLIILYPVRLLIVSIIWAIRTLKS